MSRVASVPVSIAVFSAGARAAYGHGTLGTYSVEGLNNAMWTESVPEGAFVLTDGVTDASAVLIRIRRKNIWF